jgi:hypothetical protein
MDISSERKLSRSAAILLIIGNFSIAFLMEVVMGTFMSSCVVQGVCFCIAERGASLPERLPPAVSPAAASHPQSRYGETQA